MTVVAAAAAFWVSYALLWGLVVLFGLLIVLLYRQFGLAFMRAPDRISLQGLDVGSTAPAFMLQLRGGAQQMVAFGVAAGAQASAVLFARPGCEVCGRVAGEVVGLPESWPRVRFVWVDGSVPEPARRPVDGTSGWLVGVSADDRIHRQWDVAAVPFAFSIDANGRIVDKRLVNRREDLEASLRLLRAACSPSDTKEMVT